MILFFWGVGLVSSYKVLTQGVYRYDTVILLSRAKTPCGCEHGIMLKLYYITISLRQSYAVVVLIVVITGVLSQE